MNRTVNRAMKAILRSPVHRLASGRVALITYTGRRSGREYTIPCFYRDKGDEVTIAVGWPERKIWWRNLTGDGGPVRLLVRGEEVRGHAIATRDAGRDALVRVRVESRGPGADRLVLELTRLLAAPPAVAYAAFSDSSELKEWWGPAGFTTRSLEFEPRVGGRYRIEMQPPEGDAFFLTGEFREVDPPDRLSYTFAWEDPDPDDVETLVVLSFRDLGEATEVSLNQGPFKTEARHALHHDGWSDSFDKLERRLSSR